MLLDVPIPVERGFLDISDVVVCTTCSQGRQVERLMGRYGISKGEALDRIGMQKSPEYYIVLAGYIVNTDNTSRVDLEVIADSIESFCATTAQSIGDD
jgi:dephospho-CoA kinase